VGNQSASGHFPVVLMCSSAFLPMPPEVDSVNKSRDGDQIFRSKSMVMEKIPTKIAQVTLRKRDDTERYIGLVYTVCAFKTKVYYTVRIDSGMKFGL
jgi:hypothetical protein